jgi:protein-ribulosamine 3-kinase
MQTNILNSIIKEIQNITKKQIAYVSHKAIGGGCINECFQITTSHETYFVKINNATKYPEMFEKEALGLNLLSQTNTVRIPNVIGTASVENTSFIILEFIKSSTKADDFWNNFAEKLALLHKNCSLSFGLDHDNYIGSLPQRNKETSKWNEFFILQRLQPLTEIAFNMHLFDKKSLKQFDSLFSKIDNLIPDDLPALLHGDLWSGNFITDESGQPCIIDPAVYYGHREAEIAFTTMFGGFSNQFYQYYNEYFPLEKGWQNRIDLFNLYPALVHLILFGTSYFMIINATLNKHL